MSIFHVTGFNVEMKGKMYLFKGTVKLPRPDDKGTDEEYVVVAITGASVTRNGIVSALNLRCKEIVARMEASDKQKKFSNWLIPHSRTIAFKKEVAKARRKRKDEAGLLVV